MTELCVGTGSVAAAVIRVKLQASAEAAAMIKDAEDVQYCLYLAELSATLSFFM